MSTACRAAFTQAQTLSASLPAYHLPEAARTACAQSLEPVRAALETGRGFVNIAPGVIFAE